MVTNHLADGLVAENAQLRARLDEALANAQVYGERMLQAQNERDHTKRELAEARAALLHLTAVAHRRKWAHQDTSPAAFDELHRIGNELRAAMDAGRRRENTTAGTP